MALLLRSDRLLAGSFALGLLLLHLLAHAFALSLGRIASLCGSLLFDLLPPQILHLLASVAITTSCLSG